MGSPMKILFNILLLVGGLCGAAIAFSSDITVNSSLKMINGLELSIILGAFSIIVMVNAIVDIFSTD